MTPTSIRLAAVTLLCLTTALPCGAESLASSASSAGSASLGSLSTSSNSSSPKNQVAEGDYRIIEVAALAERPGTVRLRLQSDARAADGGAILLDVPLQTVAQQGLIAGDLLSARHRPYGLAFARSGAREAIILVLARDWQSELEPQALSL
jgi:hypothetical protein